MNEFEDVEIGAETEDFHEEVSDSSAELAEEEGKTSIRKRLKKRKKLIVVLGIIGLIIVLIVVNSISKAIKVSKNNGPSYKDVAVERRTISNTITGSSFIEPNDSYNVTTIKSGDIDTDYFKEGDTVKKGDKLYQFDNEDALKSLTSAKNAVTKAEQAYTDAIKTKSQTEKTNQNSMTSAQISLSDAQDTYNKQYVKSTISGKVKEVYVSRGDTVTAGSKIADIYDDSAMKLVLPFNASDANVIDVGAQASVSVIGSGEKINGTVTEKSSGASAGDNHTSVVYVTIETENPGALTEADSGSAIVNGAACAGSANFKSVSSRTIVAEVSGTVDRLDIIAGDSIANGVQIAYINSTQAQNSLKNAQLALDRQTISSDTYSQDSQIKSAKLSLDDAKVQLEKAQDAVDDYLIEAPIDGTVVTKNAKAGDTIDTTNSQTALCVIYDLSCVKFSIDVDETEIALVKTGQTVKITADAVEGEFEGKVIKVPVDGVNQNGVTTYTVEVEIGEYGDLLPGMNVDAEITVEEAQNVLAVPVNSVSRGDIVFVKDDGTKRENDVTDMINGNKPSGGDGKKSDDKKSDDKKSDGKKDADEKPGGERPVGDRPDGERPSGEMLSGGMPMPSQAPSNGVSMGSIPMNIEIPDGYRAIKVETGINDTEYIEIKSGLADGDMVRALDTESSSAGASFGTMGQMGSMSGMGGMPGGGMPGGGMSGGGSRGGGGGMPGGGMR